MSDLESSKFAAEVSAELIKTAFNAVMEGAKGRMRSAWTKIFEDFRPYVERIYRKNTQVRLLCVKDHDVPFYQVYVSSMFQCGERHLTDEELIYEVRERKSIIINGNGGAGKTFFMRHLWLTLFKNPANIVPLFIELRALNELSKSDLKSFIRATIAGSKGLTDDVFDYFCEVGRFCFILDGFDEIPDELRDDLQEQIRTLASQFPSCPFVVSSRPDKRFAGWQGFQVFQSEPFDLERVQQLVEKVPFDKTMKSLFSKRLNGQFYNQHRSFLSNPLLSIMMLMTFKDNLDIPKSMNIFYDQAFNTLFTWHDATKAFSRRKALDIDEFRKSFAVFCLLTYFDEKYEFSEADVHKYISKSSRILNISLKEIDILRDYTESVNLLQQDWLQYVFIHRSFQEYFSALALVSIVQDKANEVFMKIDRRLQDSVIQIAYEMNPEIVTRYYVMPRYEALCPQFSVKDSKEEPFKLLSELGVEYQFLLKSDRGEGPHFWSFGISPRSKYAGSDHLVFLALIQKIRDAIVGSVDWPGFGREVFLLHDELESVLRKFKGTRGAADVIVSFQPREVLVHVESDRGPGFAKELERALHAQGAGYHKAALAVAGKFRHDIEAVRKWTEDRIQDSRKRGESIDTIFGLN